ncbi:CotD family spore coat protein [Oceanobacillus caeni]
MRRHHGPHCGCPICVYPTKVNNVHTCSESCVKHIHPSHTNVINHHTVKNIHEFPHSTSFHNVTNSVDIEGPSYEVPGPGPGVMGAFDPGYGHGKYHGHGKHHPHHCGCKR